MQIPARERQAIEAIVRSSDSQQILALHRKVFQLAFGVVLIFAGLLVAVASLAFLELSLFAVSFFLLRSNLRNRRCLHHGPG